MTEKTYIGDLKLLEQALTEARARVRYELADIKEKQRARKMNRPRDISDHAVVRFLERTGRVDVEAVRREISALIDASTPFGGKTEGVWHSDTGMVFILEGRVVVTVLSEEQSEKYIGRELVTGEVAERLATSGRSYVQSTPPKRPKIELNGQNLQLGPIEPDV